MIADGGHAPLEGIPEDPTIRHLRAAPDSSLGARLNLAAEQARGTIFQKLDDDDYYHPSFLERAVAALKGEHAIVAWDCFFVLIKGENGLRFSGHGWRAGATLTFSRRLWEQTRFRDLHSKVDWFFFKDTGADVITICASELLIVVRHGDNTWRKLGATDVDDYFRRRPETPARLEQLVHRDDVPFYRKLMSAEARATV